MVLSGFWPLQKLVPPAQQIVLVLQVLELGCRQVACGSPPNTRAPPGDTPQQPLSTSLRCQATNAGHRARSCHGAMQSDNAKNLRQPWVTAGSLVLQHSHASLASVHVSNVAKLARPLWLQLLRSRGMDSLTSQVLFTCTSLNFLTMVYTICFTSPPGQLYFTHIVAPLRQRDCPTNNNTPENNPSKNTFCMTTTAWLSTLCFGRWRIRQASYLFNVSKPEEERGLPSFIMVGGKQELSLQLVLYFSPSLEIRWRNRSNWIPHVQFNDTNCISHFRKLANG